MTVRRINASSNIDLTDKAKHYIAHGGWIPAVSLPSVRPLSLPYEDVTETMEIHLSGATAATVYGYAEDIAQALYEVEAWRRGDGDAVTFDYEPEGASNGVVQALITRVRSIVLPQNFEIGANGGATSTMTISFDRRGLWVEDATESTSATTLAEHRTRHTATFGASHDNRCPIDLTITGDGSFSGLNTTQRGWNGQMFVTNDSDGIIRLDGTIMDDNTTISGVWSVGAGTHSSSMSGSNVILYDNTGDATSTHSLTSIDMIDTTGRNADEYFTSQPSRFVVYAVASQPTGTDSLMMRCRAFRRFSTESEVGRWVECKNTNPDVFNLGEFNIPSGARYLTLQLKSAGGGVITAEIDHLIVMKVSDQSAVIRTDYDTVASSADTWSYQIEQQVLGEIQPRYAYLTGGGVYHQLPHGGALPLYFSGDSVSFLWAAVDSGDWAIDISGVVSIQVTATRRKGYTIAT